MERTSLRRNYQSRPIEALAMLNRLSSALTKVEVDFAIYETVVRKDIDGGYRTLHYYTRVVP
jgi:hypothetical protein